MRRAAYYIAVFFSAFSLLKAQNVVAGIDLIGLDKTGEELVERYITINTGEEFSFAEVEEIIQVLRNLQYFSDVSFETVKTAEGIKIKFLFREAVTLLPIVNFGTIKENLWFQLGAADFNFLGLGSTIGGYYRFYDNHSFELFQKLKYIFGSRFGINTRLGKYSTLEPAYFKEGTSHYNVNRFSVEALVSYDLTPRIGRGINYEIQLGGEYLSEKYLKTSEISPINSPGPKIKSFNKYLFKAILTIKEIDYFYQYLKGFSNRTYYELVSDNGSEIDFFKIVNEFKGYFRLGENLNFAGRIIVGISTNKESPFVPFVADSYENVRGVGSRVARGTAETVLNAEIRQTIFKADWGAAQTVGFFDYLALRPGGGDLKFFTSDINSFYYAGAGLRFSFFDYYNAVFRFDYAINVRDFGSGAFVIGFGQYF